MTKNIRVIAEACLEAAVKIHEASIKSVDAWTPAVDGGFIKRYVLDQPPKVAQAVELSSDHMFIAVTDDADLRHRRGDALVSVSGTTR